MTLVASASTRLDEPFAGHADVVVPGRRVELVGRLDSRSAHAIRCVIDAAIAAGEGVLVLDVALAEVHDSAGLGLLVGAHHRARLAGRELMVTNPSERLQRLVRVGRLGRVLGQAA